MQATLISCLAIAAAVGQASSNPIPQSELDYQKQAFKQWWGQELVLKFADLPVDGKVASVRTPYSGFDYPDRGGGTMQAMLKYDQAFHANQKLATDWERKDVGIHKSRRDALASRDPLSSREPFPVRRGGLIERIRLVARGPRTPTWYGHCNGWTAASIRHAEPQHSVTRNGVVFTPADIKGMLAEIYMYTETEFLGGVDAVIHPALLHLVLTNWLGRGAHPIGMESAIGEVVINYPIYSYQSKVTPLSDRSVEVSVTTTYAMNTNHETNEPARYKKQAYYHYRLDLDDQGQVIGGRYYGDSSHIDMLWAPLKPIQGGKKGNERGNPHVDIKEVLAIWRASVSEDVRNQWLNIDPTDEDRIVILDEQNVAANDLKPVDTTKEKKDEKKEVTVGESAAAGRSNESP